MSESLRCLCKAKCQSEFSVLRIDAKDQVKYFVIVVGFP